MADTPKGPPDPLEEGRTRLRETIKWLIASFGAIGASLAIGSQISNIGALSAGRLWLAVMGALMAFGGILLAIWVSVKVMTGSHVTLGQLVSGRSMRDRSHIIHFFEVENRPFLETYDTLADLNKEWEKVSKGNDEAEYKRVGGLAKTIVDIASYELLRSRFDRGLRQIVGGVAVAAVGIVLFAWAANPAEVTSASGAGGTAVVPPAPVLASLSLTQQGAETLEAILGADCGPSDIPVLVVGAPTEGFTDVIALPSSNCEPGRFILTREQGTLVAAKPMCRSDGPGADLECLPEIAK